MKTTCIYHADCTDGASAAAVVRLRYPDTALRSFLYGQPPPARKEISGRRVFVVDFSFPAGVFQDLKEAAGEIHWYDHHKTALPIRDKEGFGDIDLKESGATLTWKKLFPERRLPRVLEYVRDKDLWLWKLPHSREISAALSETTGILNPASPIWKKLLNGVPASEWRKMVNLGKRIRRATEMRMTRAVKRGFPIKLDGHKAYAVNWSEDASDLGEYIYKVLKYPVAVIFSYNGQEWTFSLRSRTVDVSKIAVRHKGGGHPGAAGFLTHSIEWLFRS